MHHSRTIDDGIAQLAKEMAEKESARGPAPTQSSAPDQADSERDRVIASVGGDD
jgi:hypothetical protein